MKTYKEIPTREIRFFENYMISQFNLKVTYLKIMNSVSDVIMINV